MLQLFFLTIFYSIRNWKNWKQSKKYLALTKRHMYERVMSVRV